MASPAATILLLLAYSLTLLITPSSACPTCPKPKPPPKHYPPCPPPPAVKPPHPKPPAVKPPHPKPPAVKPPHPKPPAVKPPHPKPPAVKPPHPKPPAVKPPHPKPPAVKPPPTPKPPIIHPPPVAVFPPPLTPKAPPPKETPCPPPAPSVPPPPPFPGAQTCPIDTLKLKACVDVLGGLAHAVVGGDASRDCCPVLGGLTGLDAAVCLCTAIKAKLLDVGVVLPVALEVLAGCGKSAPPGFNCHS